VRWEGHISRVGEIRKPEWNKSVGRGKHIWGIILKWILKKLDVSCGLDSFGSG
jgi:hypothetical protein